MTFKTFEISGFCLQNFPHADNFTEKDSNISDSDCVGCVRQQMGADYVIGGNSGCDSDSRGPQPKSATLICTRILPNLILHHVSSMQCFGRAVVRNRNIVRGRSFSFSYACVHRRGVLGLAVHWQIRGQ